MSLSFKDSLDNANNNVFTEDSAVVNDESDDYGISLLSTDGPVATNDSVAVYANSLDGWTRSHAYVYYSEYFDDNLSEVNDDKSVTVNQKQINLTQESNSQFIPFKMPLQYLKLFL